MGAFINRCGFISVRSTGFRSYLPDLVRDSHKCILLASVILSHEGVGNLPLILLCANRKSDNLMLSSNLKISQLLYKGLNDDLASLKLVILKALFCI